MNTICVAGEESGTVWKGTYVCVCVCVCVGVWVGVSVGVCGWEWRKEESGTECKGM